jgi:hypothetical protein
MATDATFLVDCDTCSAKVAAKLEGVAESSGFDDEEHEPWGNRLLVGRCPHCMTLVAAHQTQIDFQGFSSEYDEWSDPIRVFPNPPKTFSHHIPKVVRASITEAQKCIHAGANTAACVMLRRTMEAVCLDILNPLRAKEIAGAKDAGAVAKKYRRPLMLGEGLKELYERRIIDDRLFDWSRQIQVVGNKSAHAVDIDITRQDATDLMSFVTALIEYIFDLTLRYNQFMVRSGVPNAAPSGPDTSLPTSAAP